jgi:hypothetical protein
MAERTPNMEDEQIADVNDDDVTAAEDGDEELEDDEEMDEDEEVEED